MTKNQYRAALGKLGLSIVGAGPYFGLARRQAQRIAAGHAPVPFLIAKTIGFLLDGKLKLEDLKEGG
jgi:hypothetical protein